MFKAEPGARGQATRELILETALKMFRERGFEPTTMREIASAAEVSLGNAYYYFPSKEAIVMAYYDRVQILHAELSKPILEEEKNLAKRISRVVLAKIDILKDDRPLMGALFRYGGEPDHPLSFFGPNTQRLRQQCLDIFQHVLAHEKFPKDVEKLMPLALYAYHLGIMLYFLYDKSAGAQKTRRLCEGSADFIVKFISLSKFPLTKPLRGKVMRMLEEAGLMEGTT